jgi:hypothetical protein
VVKEDLGIYLFLQEVKRTEESVALDSKVSTELKQLSAEMEFMRYGLVSLSLLCFRSPFANLLKFWLNNAT